MKTYVATLWSDNKKVLWTNIDQREALRKYLNDEGFYVLTGAGDSLEIYTISYAEPWDIRAAKKTLAKLGKLWYILIRKQKEAK